MWRTAGMIGLALVVGLGLGCPRLMEDRASGPPAAPIVAQTAPGQVQPAGSLPQPDQAEGGTPWVGPLPPASDPAPTQPLVGPELPPASPDAVTGVPEAVGDSGLWIDPLDPASVLGQTGTYSPVAPNPPETPARLVGLWTVVAANLAGQGRAVDLVADNWNFRFLPDGNCAVSLECDGYRWVRDGTWSLSDDQLALAMGPGGMKSYRVEIDPVQPQLCLLHESAGPVLFCWQTAEGVAPPELAGNFETTFGPLQLFQSGSLELTGSYGQPAGNLRLRLIGTGAAGVWQQDANSGLLVLTQTASGFTGRWWYLSSDRVEGSWDGIKR